MQQNNFILANNWQIVTCLIDTFFEAAALASAADEQLNIMIEKPNIEPGEKGYGKA